MKLIVDFILIIGFLLNILVLIGLIRIKTKQIPHKILIIFWSFILIALIHFYSKLHNIKSLYIITFIFVNGVRLLLAPIIYIYIKSIFDSNKLSVKNQFIHFIVFFVYLIIYIIPSVINNVFGEEIFHLNIILRSYTQGLLQDVFSMIYFYFSFRLFLNSRKNIKKHYSNIDEIDFLWIRNFIFCFFIVITFDILLVILSVIFNIDASLLGFVTVIILIISMIYLGFNGLTQSTIFLPVFLSNERKIKKNIPQNELTVLRESLESILNTKKPYLTPELTLSALAEIVNVSERKLSATINDEMNTTFYDLINKYRVNEAKIRLTSNEFDKYSIVGISETCGFNSKSSFYRIFKKETGLSPTQFRNRTK